jgi:alkylated DNA repair protein alkB family protein 1
MYQKNLKSDFPEELAQVCRFVAQKVGQDFQPEASIVNFYPLATSMGGHLDDAEHDLSKPIVSISIGCSAIFLIGGREKNVEPTPILVRSGDIVVMSGESRYSYHGVPFILSKELEADLFDPVCASSSSISSEEKQSKEFENSPVTNYLKDHRINMNVRQVKYDGESWIDKSGTGHVKYAP